MKTIEVSEEAYKLLQNLNRQDVADATRNNILDAIERINSKNTEQEYSFETSVLCDYAELVDILSTALVMTK